MAAGSRSWGAGGRASLAQMQAEGYFSRRGNPVPIKGKFSRIGLTPRQMKGVYGKMRWVPVVPEPSVRSSAS
jgi:hypothetical protein